MVVMTWHTRLQQRDSQADVFGRDHPIHGSELFGLSNLSLRKPAQGASRRKKQGGKKGRFRVVINEHWA